MSEETTVVQQTEQTATTAQTVAPTATEGDAEARIAALEIEKANYKIAFLKEKSKNKQGSGDNGEETEDERISRIVAQQLAETKIAQIDSEKESIYQKALKENKELKLAQLNKTTTPAAAIGTHNESIAVTDTIITPEQITAFKSKGWSDKDIERYKKNLNRYSGR